MPRVVVVKDRDEVRDGLRELLFHLEPLIKTSGTSTHGPGLVAFLEQVDSDFDELRIINWANECLRSALGAMVKAEVNRQCQGTELTPHKMKMVAPAILHKILQSHEAKRCVEQMKQVMRLVANDMALDMDTEYQQICSSFHLPSGPGGRLPFFERSDSGNESLSSTWHQPLFLQAGEYSKLAEMLNRFSQSEVKIEAMNSLLRSQLTELVASPAWNSIKEGLQFALMDTNTTLASLSLKVHAKLLSNISPFATKEAYCNLISALTALYSDKTRQNLIPTISTGITAKKKSHFMLIQVAALITEANTFMAKYWIRHPEKTVQEMIQSFLKFLTLTLTSRKTTQVMPIQLIAAIDSKASWVTCWTHSKFSRSMILKCPEASDLAKILFNHVIAFIEDKSTDDWTLIKASFRSSAKGKGSISEHLLALATFIHGCLALIKLLPFHDDLDLPPSIGLMFVTRMIKFVSRPNLIKGVKARIASALAEEFGLHPDQLRAFIADSEVFELLLMPLQALTVQVDQGKTDLATEIPIVNVTLILVSVATSYPDLVQPHHIASLFQVLTSLLENHQKFEKETLIMVLDLVPVLTKHQKTSGDHDKLVQLLGEVYVEMEDTSDSRVACPLKTALRSKLEALFDHARALMILAQDECLISLLCRHRLSRLEHSNSFGALASTDNGCQVLMEKRFLQSKLTDMVEVTSLEADTMHWRPSTNQSENQIMKTCNVFAHLLSCTKFVRINLESSSSSETLVKRLVLLQDHDELFGTYRESESVFGLQVLRIVLRNLDVQEHLVQQFKLMNVLKQGLTKGMTDRRSLYLQSIIDDLETDHADQSDEDDDDIFVQELKSALTEYRGSPWFDSRKATLKPLLQSSGPGSLIPKLVVQGIQDLPSSANVETIQKMKIKKKTLKETPRIIKSWEQLLGIKGFKDIDNLAKAFTNDDRFDWFAAALFASLDADFDTTETTLKTLAKNQFGVVLWPSLSRAWSIQRGDPEDRILLGLFGSWTDYLAFKELPFVAKLFKNQGVSMSLLTSLWINQSFIGILPLRLVKQYICSSLIFGPDFGIYLSLALFKFIAEALADELQDQDEHHKSLMELMTELKMSHFSLVQSLPFIQSLASKYQQVILNDITG